ncbi:MAG: FAD-dependent oxidoreductase [Ornithinimicrobium sp.]
MATSPVVSLLLVGAGHAHLHLLRHGQVLADAGYAVTLLAPAHFHYSGVAVGSATGHLPADAGRVDVAALTARGPVAHHVGTLTELDLDGHRARCADGHWLDFDVISFNIGSVAAHHGIEVGEDVLTIKPLEGLVELDRRVSAAVDGLGQAQRNARITIVGGGSSSLELAANLSHRPRVDVTVIEAAPRIYSSLPPGAHRRVMRLLNARGVRLHADLAVTRVETRFVVLSDGRRLAHDDVVLATGLVASPLVERLGLAGPGDAGQGIPVRATLQHPEHDEVYAVGDCAHFLPRPLPRIGVYGVRQGPTLLASLVARSRRQVLPEFVPQRRALQVLDLGGGYGLAVRGRWWWLGRLPLRLKRFIDHQWLSDYR